MKNKAVILILSIGAYFITPSTLLAQRPGRAPQPKKFHQPVKIKKAKIAKKGAWSYLGKKTANLKADRDEMLVTAYEGSFTSLKITITNSPVHIKYMEVVFANNESKKILIDKAFSEGANSRVFDLPGNKRIIKKIVFQYQTIGNENGKAKVQVWGKH